MTPQNSTNWWERLSKPGRTMLVALAVLFVSQFLNYSEAFGSGFLTRATDTDYYTGMVWTQYSAEATGWQKHPYALLVIPALIFIYLSSFSEKVFWRRWGYLTSVLLIFVCISGQWVAGGFKLGLIAFGIAIWAAVQNRRDRRSAQQASPA